MQQQMIKKIISLVKVSYNNVIPFSVSFLAYFGMAENIMLLIYIRLLLYKKGHCFYGNVIKIRVVRSLDNLKQL